MILSNSLYSIEYEGGAKRFIKDDAFICPETEISFKVPDLKNKKITVRYHEATPGITWQLHFVEEMGYGAGVTYTKIRKEYPKNDEVLENIAASIKKQMKLENAFLEWCEFLSKSEGKVFQCVITYAGSGPTVSRRNNWLDKMEPYQQDIFNLRQYLVREGYLIEFNYYIPQYTPTEQTDYKKLFEIYFEALHGFVKCCSLIQEGDSYEKQIKEFKSPDSYFRFNYINPKYK